jgi:hypothetical protein
VAPEAEQVERTRKKTWSRARSEVFVPYKLWSLAAMSMQGIATGPPSVGSRYDAARDAR